MCVCVLRMIFFSACCFKVPVLESPSLRFNFYASPIRPSTPLGGPSLCFLGAISRIGKVQHSVGGVLFVVVVLLTKERWFLRRWLGLALKEPTLLMAEQVVGLALHAHSSYAFCKPQPLLLNGFYRIDLLKRPPPFFSMQPGRLASPEFPPLLPHTWRDVVIGPQTWIAAFL